MTLPSSLLVYSTLLGGKGSTLWELELLADGSKRAAKGVTELEVGWVSCPGLGPNWESEPEAASARSAGGTSTSCGSSLLLLLLLMLLPGSGSVTLDGKAEETGGTVGGRGGLVGLRVLLADAVPKLSGSKGTPGPTSG